MMHWGNHVWITLHLLAYTYEYKEKERYINFIKNTAYILPCHMCVGHFKLILFRTNFEEVFSNRKRMIKWMNNIHNEVNRRLKKREYNLEECKKLYYNNGKLKDLESRIIGYINLVKNYISNGMDIIMREKVVNMVVNLCYIYPYTERRKELINYANKNRLEVTNGRQWIKNMLKIIKRDIKKE